MLAEAELHGSGCENNRQNWFKMRFSNIFNFGAGGVFFVLMGATAILAKNEILIATRAPNWGVAEIVQQSETPVSGFSNAADYAIIDACLQKSRSVETLLMPSVERARLVRACQGLIANIVATSEKNAYAWFALAYFYEAQNHLLAVNRALVRSYAAAPNEQWIAEQRVGIAEAIFPSLSNEARAGHVQDLALLVKSNRGIRAIAQRYVRDEGFRGRIADVVEGLSQDDQKRFIRVLQIEVRLN